MEINVSDSIIIALQKCLYNPVIKIGVLNTKDLNNTIYNQLKELLKGELNGNIYPKKHEAWACYRQDSWEENKDSFGEYADELLEIYKKIKEIVSVD